AGWLLHLRVPVLRGGKQLPWDVWSAGWMSGSSGASGADPAGPSHWKELKATCGGSQQSPIDIERRRLRRDGRLGDILFEGYDQAPPGKWRLTNDGHTGASRRLPSIRGGGLPGTYRALQLHFHWGSPAGNGSEHTLDGRQFPMEVGGSLAAGAANAPSGSERGWWLVALALAAAVSDTDNSNYNTIVAALRNVSHQGEASSAAPNLLPHAGQLSKYYRYQGSLTTPDCSEVVVWTVFEEPVAVSRAQVTVRDRYPGSASLGRAWHGERLGQGWGWRWGNPPLAEVLLAGGLRMGWYLAQPLPLPFSLSLSSSKSGSNAGVKRMS
uniref:Alpha-carbonic anhydrase domain-containing protein n=1 Tax=Nothoprocta perdicaria TaxID=30464 RepID=A0A8C6ZFH8_NOTPE